MLVLLLRVVSGILVQFFLSAELIYSKSEMQSRIVSEIYSCTKQYAWCMEKSFIINIRRQKIKKIFQTAMNNKIAWQKTKMNVRDDIILKVKTSCHCLLDKYTGINIMNKYFLIFKGIVVSINYFWNTITTIRQHDPGLANRTVLEKSQL